MHKKPLPYLLVSLLIFIAVIAYCCDFQPPVVGIYPVASSTIGGTYKVTIDATDNVAVSKVELYIDDVLVATFTSAPYEYQWDTTQYLNGSHTLKAKAYDYQQQFSRSGLNSDS